MLLACKYEETTSLSIERFVYLCKDLYTNADFLRMELIILDAVGCCIGKPTSVHFLRLMLKKLDINALTHTCAMYFVELAGLDYSLVTVRPSKIAAAALYVAGVVTSTSSSFRWTPMMADVSGYSEKNLEHVAYRMAGLASYAPMNKYLRTTFLKFASKERCNVSTLVSITSNIDEFITKSQVQ